MIKTGTLSAGETIKTSIVIFEPVFVKRFLTGQTKVWLFSDFRKKVTDFNPILGFNNFCPISHVRNIERPVYTHGRPSDANLAVCQEMDLGHNWLKSAKNPHEKLGRICIQRQRHYGDCG